MAFNMEGWKPCLRIDACGAAHARCQLEAEVGEQARNGGVVHDMGQGLPNAGPEASAERHEALGSSRWEAPTSSCSCPGGLGCQLSSWLSPPLLHHKRQSSRCHTSHLE